MTRKEETQAKAEELYGKVDKLFPISEFVNEEKRSCFKAGAQWADKTMIDKTVEWLKEQKEIIGISFEEDFIIRFREAMEE